MLLSSRLFSKIIALNIVLLILYQILVLASGLPESATATAISISSSRGASGMEMQEINEIMKQAQSISQQGVEAIPGLTIDESYGDEIVVTIIATGLRRFNLDEFSNSYIRPVRDINTVRKELEGYVDPEKLNLIDLHDVIRSIED